LQFHPVIPNNCFAMIGYNGNLQGYMKGE
jgi:hypothetical protein